MDAVHKHVIEEALPDPVTKDNWEQHFDSFVLEAAEQLHLNPAIRDEHGNIIVTADDCQ